MNGGTKKELFISLVDSTLRVFPRVRVTLQVLRYIKANKQDLVRYIHHIRKAFTPADMENFSTTNIAVKVHNLTLRRDIYFLVNGAIPDLQAADGLIAYVPSDIEYLLQFRVIADEISKINMVKEVFPGSKIIWN